MTKAKKIGLVLLRILGVLLIATAFDEALTAPALRVKGSLPPPSALVFGILLLGLSLRDREKRRDREITIRTNNQKPLSRGGKIGLILLRIWGGLLIIQGAFLLTGVLPALSSGNFVPILTILLGVWIWYYPINRYYIKNLKNFPEPIS